MAWQSNSRQLLHLVVPTLFIMVGWMAKALSDLKMIWFIGMTAAAVWSGVPIAVEAWRRLRLRQFSIAFLVSIASIGALWIGEVWEAAAVTLLYRLGGYLENFTLSRTRAALRNLMDLRPTRAVVQSSSGEWVTIAADKVQPGQVVMVKPGDKVPVDGTVLAGKAALNTAAISGEPLPKEVGEGDYVVSGSVIENGYLEVAAVRVGSDTTFSRMICLVTEAQGQKPRVQRFLDRFAQWYTPTVVVAAMGMYVITRDLHQALTFLVIGCPGALVVATPVAIVAGLGNAARHGILIKGGERLEQIGRVDTVAFDKTGTLTKGRPTVSSVFAFVGNHNDVLLWAATAEQKSEHHLATAILAYAQQQGVVPLAGDEWQFYPGLGIYTVAAGHTILVGNLRFMTERSVNLPPEYEATATGRQSEDGALAFVAVDNALIGVIIIHDPLRPNAQTLISDLKEAGIKHTIMLTGDNLAAARRVANTLGIDTVKAGLLPEEKVAVIRDLQNNRHVVAMIGDGVNDAPALAAADISLAMGGSGTQVAIETADIALMEDRLDRVPQAIYLSRWILGIVRQNITIAVVTVLLLLLGVVYDRVGLSLGMLIHEASVLIVIANGMRLLDSRQLKQSNNETSVDSQQPLLHPAT